MDRRKRASDAYNAERMRHTPPDEPASDETVSDDQSQGFPVTVAPETSPESVPESVEPADSPEEPEGGTPAGSADEPARELSQLLDGGGGVQRAARLLISMGSERASRVIARLSQAEVEQVARAIMETGRVSRADVANPPENESLPLTGGPEAAREMLIAAFGEEEGERRFFTAVPNAPQRHFAFLNELEPSQIQAALRDESPGVLALVLAHIDKERSAQVFALLPRHVQPVLARRIARMGRLSRSTVVQVEAAIREKIRAVGTQKSQESGGTAQLAAIVRHLPLSEAEELLAELATVDPEMSSIIRRELVTVDVLERLASRDLADLLREFDEREIALFLKGKRQELRAAVLRAVSDRRATDISELFAHLGPQRKEDVDQVTQEVLDRLQERERDGTLLVPREGDRYI